MTTSTHRGRADQRHPECRDCRFFKPGRASAKCLPCGAGEFFEEKIEPRELSDNELMELYAGMNYDNRDE